MGPDVIVAGLGTMGSAAAGHLAMLGANVRGFDRFRPPHGRGAHAGGSRIFRMAYAESPAYVPMLREAHELWYGMGADTGVTLLEHTGGLMLGRPDSAMVAGALDSARVHGLEHEVLDAAEIRRRFPAFAPAHDEVGLYEEAAGVLRPEVAVEVMLFRAKVAGAALSFGTPVSGWRADATGVTVSTPGAEHRADVLVLCPGAWAPGLLTELGVPLRVERRVQHYWESPGPEFGQERCPVWIWEPPSGPIGYGLPAFDAPTDRGGGEPGGVQPNWGSAGAPGALTRVVKAAFHHHDRHIVDPDVGAAEVRPDERTPIVDWLRDRVPALWLGGKQCLYTLTPDEHFLLGRHPDHDNVFVAAGFSGHGFKFAPVIGAIIADLVLHGGTKHQIDIFEPGRFR